MCFVSFVTYLMWFFGRGIYVRKLVLHHEGALRLVGGFIVTLHFVVVVVVVCRVVFDAIHHI
jgi:hypothetical protein